MRYLTTVQAFNGRIGILHILAPLPEIPAQAQPRTPIPLSTIECRPRTLLPSMPQKTRFKLGKVAVTFSQ
jgi:hypothetical protein